MKHIKRMMMSILLTIAMIIGMMPGMFQTAYADTAYSDYLVNMEDTETTLPDKVVHFNGYDWYLIKDNSTAADAGTVTLLVKGTDFGVSVFDSNSSNDYTHSSIKSDLSAYTTSGSFKDVADAIKDSGNGKLYLLSVEEATTLPASVLKCDFSSRFSNWWLRTADYTGNVRYVIGQDGSVPTNSYTVDWKFGVRPALTLDLTAVNFSSETKTFSLRPLVIEGEGTEESPFIINSFAKLKEYAANEEYKNPDATKPTYIKIASDITMTETVAISKDTYMVGDNTIAFSTNRIRLYMADSSGASLTIDGLTINSTFENSVTGSATGSVTVKSGSVGAIESTGPFTMTGGTVNTLFFDGKGTLSAGTVGTMFLNGAHEIVPDVEITGGKYEGGGIGGLMPSSIIKNNGTLVIKGGEFKKTATNIDDLNSYIPEGYEAKEDGDYYKVSEITYAVTLTGGSNSTADPATGVTQSVKYNQAMQTVTYTASEGYSFPASDDAYGTKDGITTAVSEDKKSIIVSGTPTADVAIAIPDGISDVEVAKTAAKTELADKYNTMKDSGDYDEDGLAELKDAYDAAVAEIDKATVADTQGEPKDNGAWKAEKAGEDALDAVKTKAEKDLEEAKAAAKEELAAKYDEMKNSGDYDEDGLAELKDAYDAAVAEIDKATVADTQGEPKDNGAWKAEKAGEDALDAVKTMADKELDAAKAAAKEELAAKYDEMKNSGDYDEDGLAELKDAYDAAVAEIDKATVADSKNDPKDNGAWKAEKAGEDALDAVKTMADKELDAAKAAAKEELAAKYDEMKNSGDYDADGLTELKDAYDTAIAAIDSATVTDSKDEPKDNGAWKAEKAGEDALDAVKTIADKELENAKAAAKDELTDKYNEMKDSGDYDADGLTELKDAYDTAIAAIDSATVTDSKDDPKDNGAWKAEKAGEDALDAVKTKAQKDLEDAKAAAKDELTDKYNEMKDSGDYDEDGLTELKDAYDAAVEEIEAATVADTQGEPKDNGAWKAEKAGEDALDAVKTPIERVSSLIDELPNPEDVTKDDKEAIEKARDAFEKLTPEQKDKVPEELKSKLEDDEIACVEDIIDKLPDPDDVTIDDKDAINKARDTYDALTDEQKNKMAEEALKKLKDDEAALEKREKEQEEKDKANKQTTKVSGTPSAKMIAKGKTGLTISWNKINGADGYDIFFSRCNHNSKAITCKRVKSINGNKTFKWTKSGLKKGTAYKAYVKAYIMKNGKKTYVGTTPVMHAYTGNGTKKYTNAKSVTVKKNKVSLKKGKTFKIKAKVNKVKKNKKLMPKGHAPKLRYLTSDSKVATVNAKGKITAKGSGTCTVTVFAHNGVSKNIKVTVK